MSIKDMKHVTVEQVLALRDEAIKNEEQRDQLAEALQEVMEYGNSEHMDRRAAWAMGKARDALAAIGK